MAMPATTIHDPSQPVIIGGLAYVRAPEPLFFPESEQVPETKWHLELRTLLYQLLKLAFGHEAYIGCDQFVYWDAANPRVCLAPDAFVRFGGADDMFRSWRVWERGAPQVAVEVISSLDQRDTNWQAKLHSYRQLGVSELVRFDPEATGGDLRIWDRIDHDLVERKLSTEAARSNVLPGFWLNVADPRLGPTLRLSRDERGLDLFLTPAEAAEKRIEADAARIEADAARIAASAARIAASAERIRELEAELAKRQG
jgi:Uma2 family endonuclease